MRLSLKASGAWWRVEIRTDTPLLDCWVTRRFGAMWRPDLGFHWTATGQISVPGRLPSKFM